MSTFMCVYNCIYTLTHLHAAAQVLFNWLMTESTEKQGGLQHIGTLLLSPGLWPLDVGVSGDSEKRVLFEIKAAIAGHVGLGSE